MSTMTEYESIPYESDAYPESHPSRVGAIAKLFGMSPAPLESARILDIGCSAGANIIPLAWLLPGAKVLGVDSSAESIAKAEEITAGLGLSNIRCQCRDLRDLGEADGEFDYITVHGVFSWVNEETQEALLAVCRKLLAPQGLLYLSFNAFPGWYSRLLIRDLLLLETTGVEEPDERLRECRKLMGIFHSIWKERGTRSAEAMLGELGLFHSLPDWFLFHDLLGHENRPEYLGRLSIRAATHGLQYLGDSDLWKMAPFDLPQKTAALLTGGTSNRIALEQRLDFIRLEYFRRAIFCRDAVPVDHEGAISRIPELIFSSPVRREPEQKGEVVVFRGERDARIETSEPLLVGALTALAEAWPRGMSFAEILQACAIDESPEREADRATLIQGLFRCLLSGQVLPRLWEPPFAAAKEERPKAFALAFHELKSTSRVTSLAHHPVELDEESRKVLELLDGSRSRDELFLHLFPEAALQTPEARQKLEELLRDFRRAGLLEASR